MSYFVKVIMLRGAIVPKLTK